MDELREDRALTYLQNKVCLSISHSVSYKAYTPTDAKRIRITLVIK